MIFTHPGKMGDLIWSLATIREMQKDNPIELYTSDYCAPLLPLLKREYSHVETLHGWEVEFSAPVKPWRAPFGLREVEEPNLRNAYHLGLREWPSPTLIEYYPRLMFNEYNVSLTINPNDPWLLDATGFYENKPEGVIISFSDEYAEQKVGYLCALAKAKLDTELTLCVGPHSRIHKDFWLPSGIEIHECNPLGLANGMAYSKLVITCNSMGHPLASSLGARTIIVEPNPMRHQPVFKAPMIKKNTYIDSVNSFDLIPAVEKALNEA